MRLLPGDISDPNLDIDVIKLGDYSRNQLFAWLGYRMANLKGIKVLRTVAFSKLVH